VPTPHRQLENSGHIVENVSGDAYSSVVEAVVAFDVSGKRLTKGKAALPIPADVRIDAPTGADEEPALLFLAGSYLLKIGWVLSGTPPSRGFSRFAESGALDSMPYTAGELLSEEASRASRDGWRTFGGKWVYPASVPSESAQHLYRAQVVRGDNAWVIQTPNSGKGGELLLVCSAMALVQAVQTRLGPKVGPPLPALADPFADRIGAGSGSERRAARERRRAEENDPSEKEERRRRVESEARLTSVLDYVVDEWDSPSRQSDLRLVSGGVHTFMRKARLTAPGQVRDWEALRQQVWRTPGPEETDSWGA
jgi:hypothetical protein